MIFLEKSELPFLKCPTKIIINVNPLENKNRNPPPPPHLYPNHHAPDVFSLFPISFT